MTIKLTTLCSLALAWGCGSVKTGDLPDGGGGGGGGADASMLGTATVTTKTHTPGFGAAGATQANVPVISLLPNGEMADMKLSDANGNATVNVYPGGSVTAVYAHKAPDQGTDFATYFGVKPSDELTFGQAFVDSTVVGTMTLSWTAVVGASYYLVGYPCGNDVFVGTNSIVITETASCHQSSMELQVTAVASNGVPMAVLSTFATFANGGSQNIGTPTAAGLAHTMTVSFTGLPSAVTYVSFSAQVVLNQGLLGFVAGNSGQPTGGAFSGSLSPWAQFSGDRVVAQLDLEENTDNEEIQIFDGFSTGNLSWTVAAPPAIPELPFNAALVSGSAQWAAWSTIGAQPTTGALVTTRSLRTISGTQYPINWTFIVPPGMEQFGFPKLPAPYDKLMPTLTDIANGSSITPFLIPSVTDYDALRGMPESVVTCLTCSVAQGVFPRIVLNQVFL